MSEQQKRFEPSLLELTTGLLAGDRAYLSRAITLAESSRAEDQASFTELLAGIPPQANTVRVGISGIPGVGKSTFIEAFGLFLTGQNKRVAVLAVDPSSERSRGSILGDKTRMEQLAKHPLAYIRPTPAGTTRGGVADSTHKAIHLCEAAGYDTILVETVGVGQSETAVRHLVDFFLVLMLPGAGDELQGIKKGILELADALVIHKCDGDNVKKATIAKAELQQAMHLLEPNESGWTVPILTCSSVENKGIDVIWRTIEKYVAATRQNGFFLANRKNQQIYFFEQLVQEKLRSLLNTDQLRQTRETLTQQVAAGSLPPEQAAQKLWQALVNSLLLHK
jgi:LAO/AO transport system kinase